MEEIGRKIRAAVARGELTPEEGRKKMAAVRKRLQAGETREDRPEGFALNSSANPQTTIRYAIPEASDERDLSGRYEGRTLQPDLEGNAGQVGSAEFASTSP